jgi:GntR family transcriptional regulator
VKDDEMTPAGEPEAMVPPVEMSDDQRPIVPVRTPRTLVAEVTSNLRRAIQSGRFSVVGELPTEPELARQLGVSRGTLRQAIAILEHEGLLSRHQGIGTFVLPHSARLRNTLNSNYGISDLVRSTGKKPGTSYLSVSTGATEDLVCERLGISTGEPVAVVERVRTADDVPVAYTIDFVPVDHLAVRGLDVAWLEQAVRDRGSLYSILREVGLTVDGGVADLSAVAADNRVAGALQVKVGTPLVLLSQTDYSARGVAILHSNEYLPPDLPVQVWRKGPG